MADILHMGARWLEKMRGAHCSQPVEYRGGGEAWVVLATYGRTSYDITDESGLRVSAHVWDFTISASLLGRAPEIGDEIIAGGRRYEVAPMAGGECWRWADAYHQAYRVHTRDAGTSG